MAEQIDKKARNTQLLLPPADFADDEELLGWLEQCRKILIRTSDELDEDSAHIYGKLRRFAIREGLRPWPASRTARAVALPIARAAEDMLSLAGRFRVASRSAEAFVEATAEPTRKPESDFKIRARGR